MPGTQKANPQDEQAQNLNTSTSHSVFQTEDEVMAEIFSSIQDDFQSIFEPTSPGPDGKQEVIDDNSQSSMEQVQGITDVPDVSDLGNWNGHSIMPVQSTLLLSPKARSTGEGTFPAPQSRKRKAESLDLTSPTTAVGSGDVTSTVRDTPVSNNNTPITQTQTAQQFGTIADLLTVDLKQYPSLDYRLAKLMIPVLQAGGDHLKREYSKCIEMHSQEANDILLHNMQAYADRAEYLLLTARDILRRMMLSNRSISNEYDANIQQIIMLKCENTMLRSQGYDGDISIPELVKMKEALPEESKIRITFLEEQLRDVCDTFFKEMEFHKNLEIAKIRAEDVSRALEESCKILDFNGKNTEIKSNFEVSWSNYIRNSIKFESIVAEISRLHSDKIRLTRDLNQQMTSKLKYEYENYLFERISFYVKDQKSVFDIFKTLDQKEDLSQVAKFIENVLTGAINDIKYKLSGFKQKADSVKILATGSDVENNKHISKIRFLVKGIQAKQQLCHAQDDGSSEPPAKFRKKQ